MGPRFVLNCARIFDGSFGGQTIYQNPAYESPNLMRSNKNAAKGEKYRHGVMQKKRRQEREADMVGAPDPLADVFKGAAPDSDSEESD